MLPPRTRKTIIVTLSTPRPRRVHARRASRTRLLGTLGACVATLTLAIPPTMAHAAPVASQPEASVQSQSVIVAKTDKQSHEDSQKAQKNLERKQEAIEKLNADGYDRFIVTYKSSARATNQAAKRSKAWEKAGKSYGVNAEEVRKTATGSHVIDLGDQRLKGKKADNFMDKLAADPAVESVEPDIRLYPVSLEPRDQDWSSLWGLHGTYGVDSQEAWKYTQGEGAVVAVLDSGITRHPDLDANILPGYDFIADPETATDGDGRDSDPTDSGDWQVAGECGEPRGRDSSWHGTHVAGTIAAVADSKGVVGVAPKSKVVPVRVLGKCGGRLSDFADAIAWSVGVDVQGAPKNQNPADVINMSLGGGGTCMPSYQRAIDLANSRGAVVVVAAGNDTTNAANFQPANCQNVVTVGATNKQGKPAHYSNFGDTLDVSAPGGETHTRGSGILSTVNSGKTRPVGPSYSEYQGTSMATPHVAGVAALMKSVNPEISPARIEKILKETVKAPNGKCPRPCGAGIVDAGRAVKAAAGNNAPAPKPTPKPSTEPTSQPSPEPSTEPNPQPTPEPTTEPTTEPSSSPTTAPSPKPTTEQSPEPEPEPGRQLIRNGGFEEGLGPWSSNARNILARNSTHARSGDHSAMFNGNGRPSRYTLEQSVTLPAKSNAVLSYWLKVRSNELMPAVSDTLTVSVWDGKRWTTLKAHSNAEKGGGYRQHHIDLSRFAGQQIKLRFIGREGLFFATAFNLDDVEVTVK